MAALSSMRVCSHVHSARRARPTKGATAATTPTRTTTLSTGLKQLGKGVGGEMERTEMVMVMEMVTAVHVEAIHMEMVTAVHVEAIHMTEAHVTAAHMAAVHVTAVHVVAMAAKQLLLRST